MPRINNFRGFGIRFCCSCMDYSFRLLFDFTSMCRSGQAQFFLQVYRNSLYKRNWHLFRPRPQLFAFCLTLWHPFFTPRWQARALREYTKLRYTYRCACKSRDLKAADSGFHFSPCAVRFIHWVACMVFFFANHGTSSFQRLLTFFFVAPWHAASSHVADRQAYAYAPGSIKPSRASKPDWLTEKIKKEAHRAAMSKKAPACFAKSSGHVFNHPRREIELKESVLGSDWTWKLLMASLATTVDDTIKMADTVRKHGCQWCIRSIAKSMRRQISNGRRSAVSRPIHKNKTCSFRSGQGLSNDIMGLKIDREMTPQCQFKFTGADRYGGRSTGS